MQRECVHGLGHPYSGKLKPFPVLDPSAKNSSRKIPRPGYSRNGGALGPRQAAGGHLVGVRREGEGISTGGSVGDRALQPCGPLEELGCDPF